MGKDCRVAQELGKVRVGLKVKGGRRGGRCRGGCP